MSKDTPDIVPPPQEIIDILPKFKDKTITVEERTSLIKWINEMRLDPKFILKTTLEAYGFSRKDYDKVRDMMRESRKEKKSSWLSPTLLEELGKLLSAKEKAELEICLAIGYRVSRRFQPRIANLQGYFDEEKGVLVEKALVDALEWWLQYKDKIEELRNELALWKATAESLKTATEPAFAALYAYQIYIGFQQHVLLQAAKGLRVPPVIIDVVDKAYYDMLDSIKGVEIEHR
jgi:hypothetical protein